MRYVYVCCTCPCIYLVFLYTWVNINRKSFIEKMPQFRKCVRVWVRVKTCKHTELECCKPGGNFAVKSFNLCEYYERTKNHNLLTTLAWVSWIFRGFWWIFWLQFAPNSKRFKIMICFVLLLFGFLCVFFRYWTLTANSLLFLSITIYSM